MKKLSFILAALLVCGAMFGQEPSKATLDCDAPENFRGEYRYTDNAKELCYGTMLSWQHPDNNFWFHYDEEPMSGSIDVSCWGIRIPYNINKNVLFLTKVMFFKIGCTEHGGTVNLKIYLGGETTPGMIAYSSTVDIEQGPDEWVEIELMSWITYYESPIWIMLETSNISNAAAYCPTAGNPDGRWAWSAENGLHDYFAVNGTGGDWMVRACFTNDGKNDTEIDHFNIYRGESLDEMEQIAESGKYSWFYYDTLTETPGHYYYRLTASYEDGCESAYALDMDNPENDYVHIYVTGVNELGEKDVVVYPNPARDRVVVGGMEAVEVKVCNTSGQMVKCVRGTNEINVEGLVEGVYLLRIIDADGKVYTNKITIR